MPIALKRAYEKPARSDGHRVLVERLWPRGLSKADAAIDLWARDVAPSTELRRWFDHDPRKWEAFKRRYHAELEAHPDSVAPLIARARRMRVTFVFGSRETRLNSAAALKEYIEERCPETAGAG